MADREPIYRGIVGTAKVAFRALGQQIEVIGAENIPREGAALIASNHIGYVDFVYVGLAAQPAGGRLIRFMAKKEIFDHPVGGVIMRGCKHIPVDRASGASSFREALKALRGGELVGIFPEATISRAMEVKEIKSGAVRLAASAKVPLIPVAVWGTQRLMTKDHPRSLRRGMKIIIRVGEPLHPKGGQRAEEETERLHAAMQGLVEESIRAYPADQQPPGSWWVPARLGGSAPTLEEAVELDAAERRERARKRAAKRAGKRTKKS